jgi:hypothetical protein
MSRRIIFRGLKKKEDFSHHNSLHRKTHVEARMLDMFVSAVTVIAYYSVKETAKALSAYCTQRLGFQKIIAAQQTQVYLRLS